MRLQIPALKTCHERSQPQLTLGSMAKSPRRLDAWIMPQNGPCDRLWFGVRPVLGANLKAAVSSWRDR